MTFPRFLYGVNSSFVQTFIFSAVLAFLLLGANTEQKLQQAASNLTGLQTSPRHHEAARF